MDIERFSSLSKLLRVTALALRSINRLRHRCEFEGVVTRDELDQAEKLWILHVQRKHFSEVYDSIQNRKSHNLQRQLGLYIDCDGILKCKGRIEHAELTESARRPILLPKHDKFTQLVVETVHKQNLHCGVVKSDISTGSLKGDLQSGQSYDHVRFVDDMKVAPTKCRKCHPYLVFVLMNQNPSKGLD